MVSRLIVTGGGRILGLGKRGAEAFFVGGPVPVTFFALVAPFDASPKLLVMVFDLLRPRPIDSEVGSDGLFIPSTEECDSASRVVWLQAPNAHIHVVKPG